MAGDRVHIDYQAVAAHAAAELQNGHDLNDLGVHQANSAQAIAADFMGAAGDASLLGSERFKVDFSQAGNAQVESYESFIKQIGVMQDVEQTGQSGILGAMTGLDGLA